MPIMIPDWLTVLLAVAVIILGPARLTRLMYHDEFPPMVWLRIKWDDLTDKPGKLGQWNKLLHCPWCLSFWVTLACIAWLILAFNIEWLMWAWWVWWGALSAAYIGTMVIVRDEPEE